MARTWKAAAGAVALAWRHSERELRNYRSSARRNEVMSVTARTLSDDDIRELAAYYAASQIEVKALPQ